MKSILQFLGGALAFVSAQSGLLAILPHGVQVAIGALGAVAGVLGIRNASQAPPTVTMILDSLGAGWKTAAGVLVALVGALADPAVTGLLPAGAAHVVQLVGTVLAALGLYHAQAKAGA
jgi:hypothetical protein